MPRSVERAIETRPQWDARPIVARNVRAERARLRLRQVDLADRVGMPRSTLADVERGARRLALGEAAGLCEALGIDLRTLLAGDDAAALRRVLGLDAEGV